MSATLRIFSQETVESNVPETGQIDRRLTPHITLNQFFEWYVLPVCLVNARPRNVKQYRESLAYWKTATHDPPLCEINGMVVAVFVRWLKSLPGCDGTLSDNTVRKHCVAIQFCLDRTGPRGRLCRQGAGLTSEPPLIPKPSIVINEVDDVFTLDEIADWMTACRAAQSPLIAGVGPAVWNRSLVVFCYNTGLRIETVLALRKDWLKQDSCGNWINVPPTAIKGRKRGRDYYLNQWAMEAIEKLAATDGPALFPWPHGDSWLHATRRRIMAASPIPVKRRFGFHSLRKAFATELGRINPLAVSMALGHVTGAISAVTRDHYAHRKLMAEALNALPQPPWRPDQQMMLF